MPDETQEIIDLIDRLSRFYFVARKYGNALHTARNISTGERAILMEINVDGPKSVPEMASRRGVSKQAVQKMVDKLAARGFLEKRINTKDRRNRDVVLTPSGGEFIAELQEIERAAVTKFGASIDPAKIAATNQILTDIETALGHAAQKSSGVNDA